MANYTDAKNWFQMALADVNRIIRGYYAKDFADCAYRIQFCSEKLLKGIILLYGLQFKKLQEVSTILYNEILPNPALDNKEHQTLEKLAKNARAVETLSTSPRYGSITAGKFTPPEDLYDLPSIKEYIIYLLNEVDGLIILLESRNQKIWKKIKDAFDNARKILRPLVA